MPKHTAIRSLWRIFRRSQLSFPSIARLITFGIATALSFAPLAAEGQERPHPKQPALDVVVSASDPNLWDKIAPFQNVYDRLASVQPEICGYCCYTCCTCGGGKKCPGGCDDGNPCTKDSCGPDGCVHEPISGGTCDDGNVCTTNDTCSNGTCVGTPITGASCDDGNACTTNDTCSNGTCVGVPLPDGTICGPGTISFCSASYVCVNVSCTLVRCDDFNICTLDSCDFATDLCVHSPLPEEAGPLAFIDEVTLQWGPALGASIYNTYRGTIPTEGLGSRNPVYDHVCFESDDAQLNGPQLSVDMEDPPVGTSFYYLVDGESSSCGEGTLGTATDGTPEMPIAFCPTPP